MERIAKFEKISLEQWLKEFEGTVYDKEYLKNAYESIELPKRATVGSAGYDFKIPYGLTIEKDGNVVINTGIRCRINNGWVLKLYPRSGQGFKFGVRLANTVGIIDSDYYNSDNEGHIKVKLLNESLISKPIILEKGSAFCQGVFVPFGITEDDSVEDMRNGGFGSTGN